MEVFQELCAGAGLRDDQFVIRPRYLPPEEDFGITLTNRGSAMANAEHAMATPTKALKHPIYH